MLSAFNSILRTGLVAACSVTLPIMLAAVLDPHCTAVYPGCGHEDHYIMLRLEEFLPVILSCMLLSPRFVQRRCLPLMCILSDYCQEAVKGIQEDCAGGQGPPILPPHRYRYGLSAALARVLLSLCRAAGPGDSRDLLAGRRTGRSTAASASRVPKARIQIVATAMASQ